jgi:DNA recombination protein RmuC
MLILSIFLAGTLVGTGLVWIFLKQRTRAQNAALDERLKHRDETIERLEKQNTEGLEKMSSTQEALDTLRQTCAAYEERNQRLSELEDNIKSKEDALKDTQEELTTSKAKIAKLDTQIQADKTNHEEKLRLLTEAKENLSEQFQNLANKIFETKAKTFGEQSKEMLNPFREQMKEFKQKLEEVHVSEIKDRSALKNQVEQLQKLNQQISQDAINLTNALKGESKTQGCWGELILERILEDSGLQEGREYELEKSVTLESGKRFRPDVVVHLPEGKDVVIDSKVSLTSYEAYCSAETDEDKDGALKMHIASIENHIKTLSDKGYQNLPGLRTLGYVLMFIPIEPAFLVAAQTKDTLITEAHRKNIMLVGPTTLLLTLKTIEALWRNEQQNHNAQLIAQKAGGLYDQLVLFVEALEDVGDKLNKAQSAYDTAHKRLSSGRGNLVKRSGELKELGVKAKKDLPEQMLLESKNGSDNADEPQHELN